MFLLRDQKKQKQEQHALLLLLFYCAGIDKQPFHQYLRFLFSRISTFFFLLLVFAVTFQGGICVTVVEQ
jgi:hypothetical protein